MTVVNRTLSVVLLMGLAVACGSSGQAAAPLTTSATPAAQVAAFGSTLDYPDGLSFSASSPEAWHPSSGAYPAVRADAQYVKIEMTVVNNTGQPFAQGLMSLDLFSGQAAAEAIIDGAVDQPTADLPVGHTSKFSVGYSVQDVKDLTLTLTPGAGTTPAVWQRSQ